MKILCLLVGPKGAGKTHIGTELQKQEILHFFSVEPVWVGELKKNTSHDQINEIIIQEIHKLFKLYDILCIEALGIGQQYHQLTTEMMAHYKVVYIRVQTNLDLCIQRIQSRDQSVHINVPLEQIRMYNEMVQNTKFDWDLIVNNTDTPIENIIYDIEHLLKAKRITN